MQSTNNNNITTEFAHPGGLGNQSTDAMFQTIQTKMETIQGLIQTINSLLPGSINDIVPGTIVAVSDFADAGISVVNTPYTPDPSNPTHLVGKWTLNMNLPQSPQGDDGTQGPPGDQGAPGEDGPQGEQGIRGPWSSQ